MIESSETTLAERRRLFLERNRQKSPTNFIFENGYMDNDAHVSNSADEIDKAARKSGVNIDDKKDPFSVRLNRLMKQDVSADESGCNPMSSKSNGANTGESNSKISVLADHPTIFPKNRPLFHQIIMAERTQRLKAKESDVESLMKNSNYRGNRLSSLQVNVSEKVNDSGYTLQSIQSEGLTIQDLSPEDENELVGALLSKLFDEENIEEENVNDNDAGDENVNYENVRYGSTNDENIDDENIIDVYDDDDLDDDDENQSASYFDIGELELPPNEYKFVLKKL